LLKILEEPPRKSVLILTTSKPNSVAPTITGRCQKIYFDRLTDNDIKQKLIKSTNYNENEITIASRISLGSYTRAERILNEGINDSRETVINFLIACLRDDYTGLSSICKVIAGKNNREKAKQFLYLMNIWFRDLLHLKSGNNYAVINHDLIARLEKLNQNYPAADVFKIIIELEETEKLISGNVQLNLILLNLGLKIKKYITP
jgi:DNA polymerase-3 subunit delta'